VGWDLEKEMPTINGSMLLIAHRAIATFGDVEITPVPSLEPRIVTVNVIGGGVVTRAPDQPSYAYGDTVVVTAIPDTAWAFAGWSGGLTGTENPDTVVVLSDTTITATFDDVVSGIDVAFDSRSVELGQNWPNPFRQATAFDYGLPRASEVEIEIYDVAGRRVFVHRVGMTNGGWHRYHFEGMDQDRRTLASGVYFYRLKTIEGIVTKKMVIVR
jgi:hypothetical protein